MGIFTSRIKKHQILVHEASQNTLSEAERVYKNHVELFSEKFYPASVSGIGLMKARLFNVCFPICAFVLRWENKPETDIVVKGLSTLAAMPLLEHGASPSVTLTEDVRNIGSQFIDKTIKLISQELNEGPSQPTMGSDMLTSLSNCSPSELSDLATNLGYRKEDLGGIRDMIQRGPTVGHLTAGFQGLLETCHETLQESVGTVNYGDDARREFTSMFTGNIFNSLHLFSDIIHAMK